MLTARFARTPGDMPGTWTSTIRFDGEEAVVLPPFTGEPGDKARIAGANALRTALGARTKKAAAIAIERDPEAPVPVPYVDALTVIRVAQEKGIPAVAVGK